MIEQTNIAPKVADLLRGVMPDSETVFHLANELEGQQGRRLVIEQRKVLPEQREEQPLKAERPPREHCFFDAPGFVRYLARYGSQSTVVLADPTKPMVSAILDEANEDQPPEILTLVPQPHPRWKPWADCLTRSFEVREFVSFLRLNRRAIHQPDGRQLVLALSQVRASQEVRLHTGQGHESLNGLLVRTKIQGEESTDLVDLPETITIRTPIFVGAPEQDVEMDIILRMEGEHVFASLASGDIREAEIEAFQAMVDEIHRDLGSGEDAMVVTFGEPNHGAWHYL